MFGVVRQKLLRFCALFIENRILILNGKMYAGSDVKIVMMTNSQTGLEPTTFKIFSFNNNTHYVIYIIHTCT